MKSNFLFKLALSLVCSMPLIAPLKAYDDGLLVKKGAMLHPDRIEKVKQKRTNFGKKYAKQQTKVAKKKSKKKKHDSSSSSDSRSHKKKKTSPFQGWWQLLTKANLDGFGLGYRTDDVANYIFIDTEAEPFITINTLCGTTALPRECTNLDGSVFLNEYFQFDNKTLLSVLDEDGPLYDPENGASWWSLKLRDDGKLITCGDSRPGYVGYRVTASVYQKIDEPPVPVLPFDKTASAFPDVTDPVNIARYIHNALVLNENQPQNVNYNDTDYKSFYEREEILRKLIDDGMEFETPIRRIRVSRPGSHYLQEFGNLVTEDLATDIFTDGFAYAPAGSTVEIGGFTGKWAAMNGTYVNGVSVVEEGAVPNPSSNHVDISDDNPPSAGTFRNVFNHFLLRFDSSDASKFPRDNLGYATQVTGTPYVKVRHQFTSDMQYPAFFAAIRVMFYLQFQVSQHNAQQAYFPPGHIFLYDTWSEVEEATATDGWWGSFQNRGDSNVRTRTSQSTPSGFFNNVVEADRGVTTYNDPFGLTQEPGSFYDYNIDMANYIVSPKNLYWAIKGTPMGNRQFDPEGLPGYKPLLPGPEKAHFVGQLNDLVVVDGKPQPINPDPVHFSLLDERFLGAESASNFYYVGLINPAITCGKKIGYLFWKAEFGKDPFSYMSTSAFVPNVQETIKYGRETMSSIYAHFTRFFNEQDCDAVILDVRTNNGGFFYTEFALAELFGDDRDAVSFLSALKDNGNSALVNLSDGVEFPTFNDMQSDNSASFSRFFVRQNEQNYPGSVFKGSEDRPKKVVVLTDHPSASAGDIFPHLFLGENLDGDLGSYTTGVIIGDIDGRLKGSSSARNPVPVSACANRLVDPFGNPATPIRFRADLPFSGVFINGSTDIFYNQQTIETAPKMAPTLKGTAGGNPLPNDWETNVWPSIGLVPYVFTSGLCNLQQPVFNDRSTWRDIWLEEAIVEAMS